jgi:hypothetical protein
MVPILKISPPDANVLPFFRSSIVCLWFVLSAARTQPEERVIKQHPKVKKWKWKVEEYRRTAGPRYSSGSSFLSTANTLKKYIIVGNIKTLVR